MLIPLIIAIGSTNNVKVNAAMQAFADFRLFISDPDEVSSIFDGLVIKDFAVDSGVAPQPFGLVQTQLGSRNRSKALRELCPDADYFVGMEAGVIVQPEGMYEVSTATIIDQKGNTSFASGGQILLPPAIAQLVASGLELGQASDKFFGKTDSKQATGTVGLLSKNAITRRDLFYSVVLSALVPFMSPSLYGFTVSNEPKGK